MILSQIIELALEAILGHSSAHSLATGPVTADPFISPLGLTITPALSIKQMVKNTQIKIGNTLKVEIVAFSSTESFALSDDNGGHDFLS